ncbi:MAG: hypothetical protein JWN17_79 [Frankiales bacterium]|nr:hypothetical protein [Frankiales bacterium]
MEGLDVHLDGALVHRSPSPERLLETVLMTINAAVIDGCASFAVHAGVVALDGVAVAWPGVSGAGKSTLTGACLREGFAYVSDEALVLQQTSVRPYPKPLSLSAWSLAGLGLSGPAPGTAERAVSVAELHAVVAEPPLRLGHLLVLRRRSGPPVLEPVTTAEAAMLLLQHSFNHYKQPAEAFQVASGAAASAQCWRLTYDTPAPAAELLKTALTDQPPLPEHEQR